jgi:hypothetical protein
MPTNAELFATVHEALQSGEVSVGAQGLVVGSTAGGGTRDAADLLMSQLHHDGMDESHALEWMAQAAAARRIRQVWEGLGGAASPLGLWPGSVLLGPDVHSDGGFASYASDYRGGVIRVRNSLSADPQVEAVRTLRSEVWWVGLECQVRQEGEDEVYGSLCTLVTSARRAEAHRFPTDSETWDMGHDGQRIQPLTIRVYDGPPANVVLFASLVEHDSGDPQRYFDAVDAFVARLPGELRQPGLVVGQPQPVPPGVEEELTAAQPGFLDVLTAGLAGPIMNAALGAGDDAYEIALLQLPWTALRAAPPRRQLRRSDDVDVVDYTHSVTVTGTDDGGDRGRYAFYFDVRAYPVEERLL